MKKIILKQLFVCVSICILLLPSVAIAKDVTLEQANEVFSNYDKNIENLQKAIDLYKQVIGSSTSKEIKAKAYANIAMAYLTMGDFAKLSHTNALNDYEEGKKAAQKAIEIDPDESDGYFWYAGNLGRMAQLKSFMSALLILPEFTKYLKKAYELNPNSLFVLEAYAEFYLQLPEVFGGSKKKSIEYAERALKIDPHYTMPFTTLAKVYISEGKYDIARGLLEKVINFKDPSYRAGWVMYDKPLALQLYDSIKDKK
ncbi:MAG: tetratricopeptide repeat protein [bacterium]